MSNIDASEESMAHYQTVISPKQPVRGRVFTRRQKFVTLLNNGLFVAAFLFVAAVICGVFP